VKFLVDHQLPAALARFLESRGHVAEHVIEASLEKATDRQIFEYAQANEFVVVSKNKISLNSLRAAATVRRLSGFGLETAASWH
jgi:predicted nuclease of predicted toxin-antitoxin system